MICSKCKKKEANVHFDGVINGKSLEMELCEDCAKKNDFTAPFLEGGLNSFLKAPFNFPSASQPALNELVDLLSTWHARTAGVSKSSCPVCHWTLAQFQKTARMGCSECYLHFDLETQNFLKKIQGATHHKGKKAPGEVAKAKVRDREKIMGRLKADLEKAIHDEQYELAAALRDKIHAMEKKEVHE